MSLQSKLGTAPVAALLVVADGVVSPVPDPLRDRAVLTRLLSEGSLDFESLVGRHFDAMV